MGGMWFSLAPGLYKHLAPWTPPCIAHITELDTNREVIHQKDLGEKCTSSVVFAAPVTQKLLNKHHSECTVIL